MNFDKLWRSKFSIDSFIYFYIKLYKMTETCINIKFFDRSFGSWKDSQRRSEHLLERMKTRGIGIMQIKEAVSKGAKTLRSDGSVVAEYRWIKVAYREFRLRNARKIYPITIVEVY